MRCLHNTFLFIRETGNKVTKIKIYIKNKLKETHYYSIQTKINPPPSNLFNKPEGHHTYSQV